MLSEEFLSIDETTLPEGQILAQALADLGICRSFYIDIPRPEDLFASSWLSDDVTGNNARYCLVAKTSGAIVGAVRFEGLLISYFVLPEFQGKGYGTRMVAKGCSWIFTASSTDIILATVLRENLRSRSILERLGFRFIGLEFSQQNKTAILKYQLRQFEFNQ